MAHTPVTRHRALAKVLAKRKAWLADKWCFACGETRNLECRKRDPDQRMAKGVWSWAEPRRDAELATCVVVCARCGDDLDTARRYDHNNIVCGTVRSYDNGCRCSDCRAARAAYERRRRQRKRDARGTSAESR